MQLSLSLTLALLLRKRVGLMTSRVLTYIALQFWFPSAQAGTDWLGSSAAEHNVVSLEGKKPNLKEWRDNSFLGCSGHSLMAMGVLGWQLDSVILEVFFQPKLFNALMRLRDSAFIRPQLHLFLDTSTTRMIMINWKKFSRETRECAKNWSVSLGVC